MPTLLERQLAASVAEAQQRKRDDLDEWLSAAPVPPKRLKRTKKMSEPAAIVIHRDVSPVLEFTEVQQQMIRDTYANGADQKEFQVLMEVAKLRRLNPMLKQIHFVKRWNKDLGRHTWSAQVSVDGLRAIAERTGKYDGQDEAEFGPMVNGFPEWARVRVYRKDWGRPAVGTAYWNEYVQRTKEGGPTRFWKEMPRVMIAKCAEAIAMRKAFPEDMGGLYVDEEMQQADNGRSELSLSPSLGVDEEQDAPPRDGGSLEVELSKALTQAKKDVAACKSYDEMLRLRALLGTRAKQSDLTKRLQAGVESGDISPVARIGLNKLWMHCDRQVAKLESQLKPPPVEASYQDEPDDDTAAFAPTREPGEEG